MNKSPDDVHKSHNENIDTIVTLIQTDPKVALELLTELMGVVDAVKSRVEAQGIQLDEDTEVAILEARLAHALQAFESFGTEAPNLGAADGLKMLAMLDAFGDDDPDRPQDS